MHFIVFLLLKYAKGRQAVINFTTKGHQGTLFAFVSHPYITDLVYFEFAAQSSARASFWCRLELISSLWDFH